MESCDVLIIGGGPAGSSCAWRLVSAGMKVIVLDKSPFPRDKVCAGWITPAVLAALAVDPNDYQQHHVCQAIHGFRTGPMQGPIVFNHYDHAVSYGIRRYEFDDYLLKRSKAKLLLGETASSIRRRSNHWIINDSITTPMLVGAGGHFCPVARYLGAKIGKNEPTVSAQEIEFKMSTQQQNTCAVTADIPELYFYPDFSGYGWLFRKGDYLNIGVGREATPKIAESVMQFYQWLMQSGKISNDTPANFKGHAYLLYDHATRPLINDGVLLVGDAAGLACTQSGEGIRAAVESGLIAADVIQNSNPYYQRNILELYATKLTQRFGKRKNNSADKLPTYVKHAVAKKMLANRFLSRHILLDHYFLRASEPALRCDADSRPIIEAIQ